MTITVDPVNKSITLQLTDSEWIILVKSQKQNQNELRDLFSNWIQGKSKGFDQEDRELLTARLKNATREQLDSLKVVLGIKEA